MGSSFSSAELSGQRSNCKDLNMNRRARLRDRRRKRLIKVWKRRQDNLGERLTLAVQDQEDLQALHKLKLDREQEQGQLDEVNGHCEVMSLEKTINYKTN